jgi:beta-lactamase class A
LVVESSHVAGGRFDRDEKHLQTESWVLEWPPEYVDAELLTRAYAAVPAERKDAAFRDNQKDPRDTATPRGMASLLQSLADGRLLSSSSTKRLLEILSETVTFSDRLQAGISGGRTLGA